MPKFFLFSSVKGMYVTHMTHMPVKEENPPNLTEHIRQNSENRSQATRLGWLGEGGG